MQDKVTLACAAKLQRLLTTTGEYEMLLKHANF